MKSGKWKFFANENNKIAILWDDLLVTRLCSTIDELRDEVHRIIEELEEAFERGSKEYLERLAKEKDNNYGDTPEEIWSKLKIVSEEEMIRIFNALGESRRVSVATYIFEHANMFSGRGAIFAEFYNQETHKLEK